MLLLQEKQEREDNNEYKFKNGHSPCRPAVFQTLEKQKTMDPYSEAPPDSKWYLQKEKVYFNTSYITYIPRSALEEGINGTYINFQLQVNAFSAC